MAGPEPSQLEVSGRSGLPGAPAAADAEWAAPRLLTTSSCCSQASEPNSGPPHRALPCLLFSLSAEAAPRKQGANCSLFLERPGDAALGPLPVPAAGSLTPWCSQSSLFPGRLLSSPQGMA